MQDGDVGQITHRAFQVRPASSENRSYENFLVEPVSTWALSQMLDKLRMDEAYKFYSESRTFTIKSLDNHAATFQIDFTLNTNNHLSFTDVDDLSKELVLAVKSHTSRYLSSFHPSILSCTNPKSLIALQVTTAADHDIKTKDTLEKTFGTRKIKGTKKEVERWDKKTTQYVLGLPEDK
ncbi:hypothetical protein F5887DRAFT_1160121 [Amanita rubescens]|nr:hypothetical protein F5887DRAFT_1160121 [Amanita rubescens]